MLLQQLVNLGGRLLWHLEPYKQITCSLIYGNIPAKVLPCSKVMLAASLSQFSRTNCVNLNMICCRAITLVALHAGNAFCALSTAALSSASVLCGTLVTRLLVAGSCNSINWVASDLTNLLSIKYWGSW